MTLSEYLAQKQAKENFLKSQMEKANEQTITVDAPSRLKSIVERFNANLEKMGVNIMTRDGKSWEGVTSTAQLKLPKGLSEVARLAKIEAFAAEKKKELGALEVEFLP